MEKEKCAAGLPAELDYPGAARRAEKSTRKPLATELQIADLTKETKGAGSGFGAGGFPDFAAHAIELSGHAHQHRLCFGKEPTIQ
jgi:hypothetical protein